MLNNNFEWNYLGEATGSSDIISVDFSKYKEIFVRIENTTYACRTQIFIAVPFLTESLQSFETGFYQSAETCARVCVQASLSQIKLHTYGAYINGNSNRTGTTTIKVYAR